ncbi:N-acetylglucosamine kinase [Actinopolymorpha alba]|uniref:N-acetylglucosamine kinase n=1 Tax=Actinopolymorpha alba TaxID=533267 RepID=UPI000373BE92|nr:BadF/BadG/BcrA/BcrD ATPase family protein [Actinopolymorpha alba]
MTSPSGSRSGSPVGSPAGVAAIDGGQTGLRLRVWHGGRDATATTGGFAYGEDPATTVISLVERAWSQLPAWAQQPVERVGMGLTGDYRPEELRRIASATAHRRDASEVRIAHDATTAHLGALDGGPGVVVVAGTGVVALAVTSAGETQRVDGWGHVLGDEGGGFSVGRHGLRAALAAYDGRGPQTLLAAQARDSFGPLDALPRHLYGTPAMVAEIATFSRQVAEAARAGDAVARGIWQGCVEALACTATAAIGWYLSGGCDVDVRVSWAGGLFGLEDLVGAPWRRQVATKNPAAVLVAPAGDGIAGARVLALAERQHPISLAGGGTVFVHRAR